jgi:hypothetical protein
VKLINLDEMVVIGPGSEWFWTAISGVVLAATFLAIYRQLRIQASTTAFDQLTAFERELSSERLIRAKLLVLCALRDGADPVDVPPMAANSIALFWEKLGSLTRAGHIDAKLLRNGSGPQAQVWWPVFAPWIRSQRAEEGDPKIFENFEWLAKAMDELDRRAGVPLIVTPEWLAISLERRIGALIAGLHEEQALRAPVPSMDEFLLIAGARLHEAADEATA